MHAFSHDMCICIRVAAAAEEVVYEVVAEPQEPQGQAPQDKVRGESAQGPTHPRPNSRQAPVHILLFQLIIPMYVSITCALGLGIV